MKKFGQILLCGLSNAGKSTLINKIADYDFALTNKKPQTTRKQLKFLYKSDNYEIAFLDTPGFHKEKNVLDKFMNKEIIKGLKNSNLICFIFDASQTITNEAELFLKIFKKIKNKSFFIVFTKTDLIKNDLDCKINFLKEQISKFISIKGWICTNKYQSDFVNKFIKEIEKYFLYTDFISPINLENKNFTISEIIRGEALNIFRQEIPYGIHVKIEENRYDYKKNLFYIEAYVICENKSQKKIIIGGEGKKIKELGTKSRLKLLSIYDSKIYLDLKVKVWENWRNDEKIIKKII